MKRRIHSRRCPRPERVARRLSRAAAFAIIALGGASGPSWAADDSAQRILKAMADYVGSQDHLSLKFDADIGVVTPAVEKIQFTASGDVTLSRPDKFRISRTGGYADVELISDGSSLTVHDRDGKRFAQVPPQ